MRYLTREWIEEFNQRRPHEALGNLTPEEWKLKVGYNEIMQLTTVWDKGYLQVINTIPGQSFPDLGGQYHRIFQNKLQLSSQKIF